MRLRPFWLSVIFIALVGCGSEAPSEQAELYVNRESLDFGQEVKTHVYVNQEDIRHIKNLDTPVKDGDEVSIVPAIAGGR